MNLGYEQGMKDGIVSATYLIRVKNVINDRKVAKGFNSEKLEIPIEADFSFLKSQWHFFPISSQRALNYRLENTYIEINNKF